MKKLFVSLILIITISFLVSCKREENILRVGMDLQYPPFETVENNKPVGISVDIANALGEFLGMKVKIINTNFQALIPALQSEEIDVIVSSMSNTEERSRVVSFSKPYFFFQMISLVNKEFASANNLTEESTVEDILAIENIKFVGIASQVSSTLPESYNKEVKQVTSMSTAIEDVVQGVSDILLMSGNPVADARNKNPDTTMIIWASFFTAPISIATRKGNTELLEKINIFVDSMSQEGGLYETLKLKYDDTIRSILGGRGFDFYLEE